jgi:hypothetical protein
VNEICSRFILKDVFDLYKDINVSFETTIPININNGLVIYATNPAVNDNITTVNNLLSGAGLGLLAKLSPGVSYTTGHLLSIALDGIGEYGLKDTFIGTNNTGLTDSIPLSITTRALRNSIPFTHLNTSTTIETLTSTDSNKYRVRLKGYLNKVYIDSLQGDEYINIYELSTNVDISDIPRFGQIGFSYYGLNELGLKDITYSGQISI